MESINNRSAGGVPPALAVDAEWEVSSTVEKLQHIATKMLDGHHLNEQEQDFLTESAQVKQSVVGWDRLISHQSC